MKFQAKFDEAEALLRETLKIWQNQFGKENENEKYATFQGNLAIVLKSQVMHFVVTTIRKLSLGPSRGSWGRLCPY